MIKNNNLKIFLIIVLGLVLRLYKISERFIFGPEQALSLWPIVRLFEEKRLTLIGLHLANYKSALFRPPFFIYLFALPLKIFKFNPLGLGILFIFLGLGTTLVLFLATKILFNQRTALLTSFLYATNFYLINNDRNVWTYTPIIFTSSLIIWLIAKILKNRSNNSYFFLIGCLLSLSFSFHFQTVFSLLSFSLLSLFFIKVGKKQIILFLAGIGLFLSPLIIFNLRHNFIMARGIINLLFDNEVILKGSENLFSKLNNGLGTFADLSLSILRLQSLKTNLYLNCFIFVFLFLMPAFYIYQQTLSQTKRVIVIYFLFSCLFSLIGLMVINQGFYSATDFYLWFLIPLLLIIWASSLTLLIKNYQLLIFSLLALIIFANFYSVLTQKPNNYQQKIVLINYILKETQGKSLSLKFINQDALAYDYLFYYRTPFYNLNYNDINLIEQWQPGKANFFIIHGNYDWREDKYQILPYHKINNFGDVKVVIK